LKNDKKVLQSINLYGTVCIGQVPKQEQTKGGVYMRKAKDRPNEKLRDAIYFSRISQENVAKSIGIDPSTFSQKMNGHSVFTIPEAIRIAKLLHKSMDEIFFE
jgi:DNA-binding XRE family transcriptional regulator